MEDKESTQTLLDPYRSLLAFDESVESKNGILNSLLNLSQKVGEYGISRIL
jgi:hypothetical protein